MFVRFFAFLLFVFAGQPLLAQEKQRIWDHKLVKRFLSSEKDSSRSAGFVVLPALGYAQETGLEFGLAGVYNFYVDKADTTIRTSNLTFIGTFTTQRQTNLKLTADVWSPGNLYHYFAELRFRDFPFNYYGTGNDTWLADEDVVVMQLVRIRAEVERRLAPNYYTGLAFAFEHLGYTDREVGGIFEALPAVHREGGYFASLGVTQLYDTRDINTYTTRGFLARLKYSYSPGLGSQTHFKGSLAEIDLRGFVPLSAQVTLGLNGVMRSTWGKNVPFYAYHQMGGDMIMRGYYNGRYRDQNLLATQAELRYRFHPRIGVAGFVGTGSTFRKGLGNTRFVPSYGGGIRYFFDLEHSSSIRLEYGVGEKRPGEKRQGGFYLSLSEAF